MASHPPSSRSQPGRPSGPFTVTASNLPFRKGTRATSSSKAHLPTSAPFQARAPGPVSGQLYETGQRRSQPPPSRFPAAFRPPASASWASCSRQGSQLSLRSAYRRLGAARRRTLTGFPRSARMRYGQVRASSVSRGRRCSHGRGGVPGRRLPLPSGQPLVTPAKTAVPGCGGDETSTKDSRSFAHLAFPSPVTPGRSGSPWALLLGFTPG
jgi:hypothetical protein